MATIRLKTPASASGVLITVRVDRDAAYVEGIGSNRLIANVLRDIADELDPKPGGIGEGSDA